MRFLPVRRVDKEAWVRWKIGSLLVCVLSVVGACTRTPKVLPVPEKYTSFSHPGVMRVKPEPPTAFHNHHKMVMAIPTTLEIVSENPVVARLAFSTDVASKVEVKLLVSNLIEVLDGDLVKEVKVPGGKINEIFYTLNPKSAAVTVGVVVRDVKTSKMGQAVVQIGEKIPEIQMPAPEIRVEMEPSGKKKPNATKSH